MVYCGQEWLFEPDRRVEIDFCLRVESCTGPGGVMLPVADGANEEVFTFFPDRVYPNRSRLSVPVDLTDGFATLQVRIVGRDFGLLHDGRRILHGAGQYTAPAHQGRRVIQFGSRSSAAMGKAHWRCVRYRIQEL